jgi:hypothetical protein
MRRGQRGEQCDNNQKAQQSGQLFPKEHDNNDVDMHVKNKER